MKLRRGQLIALAMTSLALSVCADEPSANLQYNVSGDSLESPPDTLTVWQKFRVTFGHNADEVFADRFHPLNELKWNIQSAESRSLLFHDYSDIAAQRAFSDSVAYGLREATVDLPIFARLDDTQSLLADLLRNSLGAVDEESVAPVDPSFRAGERSWWDRLSDGSELHYGIRPLRTNPYAFLSFGFRDGENVIALANLRYHYLPFRNHSFELALSIPLTRSLSIDVGSSYQIGDHDEKRLVVKLFKEFKGGGMMHVGFEIRDRPSCIAGMTFPL